MANNERDNHLKLRLQLNPDDWHSCTSEGIWVQVTKYLNGNVIAIVDNIPFFTRSLSLKDVVSVRLSGTEVVLNSIVERGGHSTYRVFFKEKVGENLVKLEELEALGCEWERATFNGGDLYAVDIPPFSSIYSVFESLVRGQTDGIWMFEEGYVGHDLGGNSTVRLT